MLFFNFVLKLQTFDTQYKVRSLYYLPLLPVLLV